MRLSQKGYSGCHLTSPYKGRLLRCLITLHKLSTSSILRSPFIVIECCLKSHIVSFETVSSRRPASQTFASLASIPGRVCQIVVSICSDEVGDLHHRSCHTLRIRMRRLTHAVGWGHPPSHSEIASIEQLCLLFRNSEYILATTICKSGAA